MLLSLLLLAVVASRPVSAAPDLHEWRAQRRAAVRAQVAAKSTDVPFGLLVLPIDFADARAPEGWDPVAELGPRLQPDGPPSSLASYFTVASNQHLQLEATLGPLIHLPGIRQDYSDLGWNGATRTRAMAQTALEAARAIGIDFSRADRDGDGEVDGVLLLHADVGLENDPDDGLIVPLQFFLETPVLQGGVRAQSYAVASWRSALGVWAHETAHLFGLEDRYDLAVPSSGEAVPRGGLGAFSLMSAGYWGSGDGHDPALIDAYSASQLGWCVLEPLRGDGTQPVPAPAAGRAFRVWSNGESGPEFFVLERRGTDATYDGGVSAGWVVTHIDESLPEGQASSNQWPDRHLRARLVEADGDTSVARGLDQGDAGDLFPGATGNASFTPQSDPSSDGYAGPSGVRITDIGVETLTVDDRASYAADVTLSYQDSGLPAFIVDLAERGLPLALPEATVTIVSGAVYGTFPGNEAVEVAPLHTVGDGLWRSGPLSWEPAAILPMGAVTTFDIVVRAEDPLGNPHVVAHVTRDWVWTDAWRPLDFASDSPLAWPGAWQIEHSQGEGATTWYRWRGAAGVTRNAAAVLACTGDLFPEATAWPQVLYANNTEALLTSAFLPADVTAVRLVHHVETEALPTGVGVDAAVVEWVDGGGAVVPGLPVDGYPTTVAGEAQDPLHGRAAWAGVDSVRSDDFPVWRADVVPVPAGPGPWRLRLRMATSPGFRERGWLVARLDTVRTAPPASAFPVAIERGYPDRLRWSWPGGPDADGFVVHLSEDGGGSWRDIIETTANDTSMTLWLPQPASTRRLLRVTAQTEVGDIASRPVVWTTAAVLDAQGALGIPRPNPARTQIVIPVEAAQDAGARLLILDARGRVVRSWGLPGGAYDLLWDGTDDEGRRNAAGVYTIHLRVEGTTHTRKVTWLP